TIAYSYIAHLNSGIQDMAMVNQKQSLEVLEAEAHVWNQLGIPDVIHKHGGPMTLTELLDALPAVDKAKANCMYRLMRILVHSGFFVLEKLNSSNEDGYSLTPASRLLVGDRPMSMKPFVISQIDPILIESMHHLSRWFQTTHDPTPFHTANNGTSFWEKKERNPRFSHLFDQGMESDTPMVASVITRDCRQVFEGLDSLVDVGGGTGTLAKAIAQAFPQIHCTVLDLPHIVAGLEGRKNLKYIEGNMFDYIPPSDAWVLHDWSDEESVEILKKCKESVSNGKRGKVIIIEMVVKENESVETQLLLDMLMMALWLLHDWSDEESVKILKKCKEAVTSNGKRGKVIIIEMVVKENESVETQLLLDMLMMATFKGKERTEKEWANLISDAGFSGYRIYPVLALRSIIEIYP
ncbi:UNVERIFIED_CONTAM: putative O-methyltransferase 3, partial [Sesamum indicum]